MNIENRIERYTRICENIIYATNNARDIEDVCDYNISWEQIIRDIVALRKSLHRMFISHIDANDNWDDVIMEYGIDIAISYIRNAELYARLREFEGVTFHVMMTHDLLRNSLNRDLKYNMRDKYLIVRIEE